MSSATKALVLGANGFLGSHVTRQLVAAGRDVRVLVRRTSDTRAIDGLAVERCIGDVLDPPSLRAAMDGCATVFHCVVDTRAWLHDPAPLFRTNVEGLRNAIDAALTTGVQRYVFTSTIGTIGRNGAAPATERDEIDPDRGRAGLRALASARRSGSSSRPAASAGFPASRSASATPTARATTGRRRTAIWCGRRR